MFLWWAIQLLQKIKQHEETIVSHFKNVDFTKKIVLVTCHRRENFGEPFIEICDALLEIADTYSDTVQIIYPVHPNPNVKEIAYSKLKRDNIKLVHPLDYHELIWMMDKSTVILTDSGGIQEEAPSLSKPVLVMREVTERTEGVDAGTAILVGSDRKRIVTEVKRLLNDPDYYSQIATAINPYGDGTTSYKIKEIVAGIML
jgi:UDP-N-acetylglucosamine 2-epimerase (non-hydrolysing)